MANKESAFDKILKSLTPEKREAMRKKRLKVFIFKNKRSPNEY